MGNTTILLIKGLIFLLLLGRIDTQIISMNPNLGTPTATSLGTTSVSPGTTVVNSAVTTTATGLNSTASGGNTTANGATSTSGGSTISSGNTPVLIGATVGGNGNASAITETTVGGTGTTTAMTGSTMEVTGTTIPMTGTTVEGTGTTISMTGTTMEGTETTLSITGTTMEGTGTTIATSELTTGVNEALPVGGGGITGAGQGGGGTTKYNAVLAFETITHGIYYKPGLIIVTCLGAIVAFGFLMLLFLRSAIPLFSSSTLDSYFQKRVNCETNLSYEGPRPVHSNIEMGSVSATNAPAYGTHY